MNPRTHNEHAKAALGKPVTRGREGKPAPRRMPKSQLTPNVAALVRIGIDPGVSTGYAVVRDGTLTECLALPIHDAMALVRTWADTVPTRENVLVVFEDARLIKGAVGTWDDRDNWSARRQGVGSVKRDCGIWEDYLTDLGVQWQAVRPKGKVAEAVFQRATGWDKRSNQHGRDAAMLLAQHIYLTAREGGGR